MKSQLFKKTINLEDSSQIMRGKEERKNRKNNNINKTKSMKEKYKESQRKKKKELEREIWRDRYN